jgi:hypothetical protein
VERPEFDDFAWFIGLFEGEGTIVVHRTRRWNYLHMAISMTDEDVVRQAQKVVGGNVNGPSRPPSLGAHCKSVWRWQINGHEAHQLLMKMLPHLHSRRKNKAMEVLTETGLLINEHQLELVE